jgi:signal transduction histidine kinase
VAAEFKVGGASRSMPPGGEVVLIRAAQEGLANVRKHAAARFVTVSVAYGEADVTLTVADDGAGFTPGDCSGFGLTAMRARVEQVGGTLDVDTAPGHGATLTVRIPA